MNERTCPACGETVSADRGAATCPRCGERLARAAPSLALPTFEAVPYHAAPGASVVGVVLMLAAGLAAALVMGALASTIGQFVYFIFVFPLAIGLGVGLPMMGAGKVAKMHSPIAAGLLGLWCGVVAMVTMHVVDYLWLRTKLPAGVDLSFVEFLHLRAEAGVVLAGNLNLGYYGSILYWLIEVAVVAGIVFACCLGQACQPFCPRCELWKKETTYGPYRGSPQAAKELVEAGRVARLALGQEDEGPMLELVVAVCPGCREEGTIDVKLQKVAVTKEGRTATELCHVTYPGEALGVLRSGNAVEE